LVPEITMQEARLLAERLRDAVATYEFPEAAGIRHLTVSVGVAAWHPEDRGSEVVSRADAAMYRVKAIGGNGVAVIDLHDVEAE